MLEQVYNGFPKTETTPTIPLRIYELEPLPGNGHGDVVDLGAGQDHLLVSHFFGPENGDGVTFRWSTYKGGVFLPAFDADVTAIEIRMTPGPRPEYLGRPYCVLYLNGVRIGVIWPEGGFRTYRFEVPDAPRQAAWEKVPISLFLIVSPFSPSATMPGSSDHRALGMAVDYVKLIRGSTLTTASTAKEGRVSP